MRQKHKDIIEASGATLMTVERRKGRKDALAYIVQKDGIEYRWAVSSVDREVPPWEFDKKPSKKYIYGSRLFIYRMWDVDGQLLYIGKTTQLDYRLYAHFYKYKEDWKDTVTRIDVCEFLNDADMHVYEMYLITKFKPRFNRHASSSDTPSFDLPELVFKQITGWG